MEPRTKNLLRSLGWWVILFLLLILIGRMWQQNRKKEVRIPESDWAKLQLVLQSVDRDYVDEIDQKAVTEKILPDLLAALDPHSVYLPPVELKEAEEDLQGGFDGIGIQFSVPNDTAIVSQVIVGGPSEKAGLLSGDRVVQVDDRVIAGVNMPQDSMVRLMKGKRGTRVEIHVMREGVAEPLVFPIIRDVIPVNSVDVAFMLNDTTGYIKLSKFARSTYLEFLKAALSLREQGMRRLVFDLRDNTGGYLDKAVQICNEFLPKDRLIVYTEGRKSPRANYYSDGHGVYQDIPLVVLINEGSASASEIFAGAMQDNDRATIIGRRSFGKGLVQQQIPFSDGSLIRLTVARYYTPSGRCIQKPYEAGDSKDYEMDLLTRYEHGEYFSQDSIKHTGPAYKTHLGRVVYGGGGITPDIFIPEDTVNMTSYYKEAAMSGLILQFAFNYTDDNRPLLNQYKSMRTLSNYLKKQNLVERFAVFADQNGLKRRNLMIMKSHDLLERYIDSRIIYNMLDEQAWNEFMNLDDPTIRAALEVIRKNQTVPKK